MFVTFCRRPRSFANEVFVVLARVSLRVELTAFLSWLLGEELYSKQ